MNIRLFWKLINYVASQDERRIDRYGNRLLLTVVVPWMIYRP